MLSSLVRGKVKESQKNVPYRVRRFAGSRKHVLAWVLIEERKSTDGGRLVFQKGRKEPTFFPNKIFRADRRQ